MGGPHLYFALSASEALVSGPHPPRSPRTHEGASEMGSSRTTDIRRPGPPSRVSRGLHGHIPMAVLIGVRRAPHAHTQPCSHMCNSWSPHACTSSTGSGWEASPCPITPKIMRQEELRSGCQGQKESLCLPHLPGKERSLPRPAVNFPGTPCRALGGVHLVPLNSHCHPEIAFVSHPF